MNRNSKRITALGAATLTVMGTGIAFAAWTTNGTGQGTAAAGTAAPLSISSTALTGLFPTQATTASVTVSNSNPYKVALTNLRLTSVTVSVAPQDGGTTKTCTDAEATADITSTGLALGTAADVVTAANGTDGTKNYTTFPVAVSNALPGTCQGAAFVLHYAVDGVSSN